MLMIKLYTLMQAILEANDNNNIDNSNNNSNNNNNNALVASCLRTTNRS